MKKLVLRLSILCALLLATSAAAEVVTVYTSASFAPLMLGDGRGIYPDLIGYLNRLKPGGLTFKLQFMPRKRLQVKLEDGSINGIVIGMMPEWFDDVEQKKYLWSAPFSTDRYALVSLAAKPVSPDAPAGLVGASVGVTLGYSYPGIDGWLASSRVLRSEGPSDEKNLEKLLLGRLDCVIVAESMARYFIRAQGMSSRLHLAILASPPTERRMLAPHSHAAAFEKIAPVLRKLKDDPAWQRIVATYR
ncbi:substrate-binding periplasmic protein [Massilia antarctica]|uniref:substrate-binding periplasmic protein n=1 Tax=Massilia antarctica TaxID=2765360 RepID=UPI0006BB607A|nr:transporter substrate-binding domain-containing protein [Massilia sp. H27-R4]MCY0916163.1 transporter substrate-binding domain-containing protein [Massilia sp. H27-R4]CUI08015.1 ABC-type amino acid transport/signal transduction systems, periplasmic component/domain [Janthinobacterium sp. CG23_2]CUU31801.1 ABC-type amino acid transport/signal transduction systems, periplasmic component/domain [Janthinobacterium sp. CG23_2]